MDDTDGKHIDTEVAASGCRICFSLPPPATGKARASSSADTREALCTLPIRAVLKQEYSIGLG